MLQWSAMTVILLHCVITGAVFVWCLLHQILQKPVLHLCMSFDRTIERLTYNYTEREVVHT